MYTWNTYHNAVAQTSSLPITVFVQESQPIPECPISSENTWCLTFNLWSLSARLDLAFRWILRCVFLFSFGTCNWRQRLLFMYCAWTVAENFDFSIIFSTSMGPVNSAWDPQTSFFSNFFIKNGSCNTIHTFKNYFTTVFSVSAKISSIQTDP